jgi:ureidoglycolate lyase
MKLLRYGDHNVEKWGLRDADGHVRTLDDALANIIADVLSPAWIAQLQALDPSKLPLLKAERRIGPAIPRPLNFVCIGLNYADHAAETGSKIPK